MKPSDVHKTIGRYMLPDVLSIVVDLDRSKGSRLIDARDGSSYLDCFTYLASHPVGHNHPLLHDAEFERVLLRAARAKPSNADFWTVEMAQFVETFSRLAVPQSFRHLFFVEGGSVAVENAIKTAFDWKIRLNQSRGVGPEVGTKVLHFRESFHGRTGYSLSLTNTADPRKTKFFPKFDWPRVLNPKCRFPLDAAAVEEVSLLEREALTQIEAAFAADGDEIAAIIIEPIQGEGGDNHFRSEFHHALRRAADEHDALLIYDEVQTGMGLTGKMWAYEHYGIIPDILCFGKKAQVCGIMATARVDEVEQNTFVEGSRINSTWGGSLVDMVRCARYLQIIEQERLVENAASVGDYLLRSLEALCAEFPALVSNARGRGLMCAIDAADGEARDRIIRRCFEEKTLVLKCGTRSVRFRPALNFTNAEVDELVQTLRTVLAGSQ